jgi:hypothetical protein
LTDFHLKIFMLVTVKYNLEAISMIACYAIDDMTVDISIKFKFAFSQVHVTYGFTFV